MTTNQTIDGVPRGLVEWAYSLSCAIGYRADPRRAQLRALLDAPAVERKPYAYAHEWAGWISTEGPKDFKAVIEREAPPQWAVESGQARNVILLYEVPAAQPQGEPVAEIVSKFGDPEAFGERELIALKDIQKFAYGTKLYAEQPAPVASEGGEPYAYEYEFATMLYTSGPGKFKKVLTLEPPDQHEIDAGCIINVKPLYSLELRKYDDTLLPFLAMMRKELHANSHKGDREGWLNMSVREAVDEITHHFGKLANAAEARDVPQVEEYSADLANCAMMLLDVCGGLGRA